MHFLFRLPDLITLMPGQVLLKIDWKCCLEMCCPNPAHYIWSYSLF